MIGASVQTAADTAPLTLGQVLIAIACMALLAALVAAPELIRAWRRAKPIRPRQETHL